MLIYTVTCASNTRQI